ncbi:MAG TPA: TIR domain-containing protein [Burkholderiaceae bacterium]|nr:TIR domain-containing protein [Burkholderiaceae bacterium]
MIAITDISAPSVQDEQMADIFLSYAEEDRKTALALAQSLESAGWSVWWDRRIPPGSTWRETIEKALDEMRCMVVLWSRHSVHSHWVYEEAEIGRARRVLVPVLIERVDPPLGFRSIHAADLAGWEGDANAAGALQLVAHLESVLGRRRERRGPQAPKAGDRAEAVQQRFSSGRRLSWVLVSGASTAVFTVVFVVTIFWQSAEKVPAISTEHPAPEQAPAAPMPHEPIKVTPEAPETRRQVEPVRTEKVTFSTDVFFLPSQAEPLQPEQKEKLDDLVDRLSAVNLEVLIAVGHADSVEAEASTRQELSTARAEAIKNYLVERGIESSHVYTEGKAAKSPIDTNATPGGRAKNRRVEIEAVGTRTLVSSN